jgi:DNA transformation protein
MRPDLHRHGDPIQSAAGSMKKMVSNRGFERFVLDQLSEIGMLTSRKMFGGVGLYCDELFFGLIAGDELYLKVDDETREAFEEAGCTPFRPYADRPATMQYYNVPVEVLESAPTLVAWGKRAVAVAARATQAKSTRRRSPRP